VNIGSKAVGAGNPTYIIAEIGVNHNGDMDIARKLIDTAVWPAATPSNSRSARPRSASAEQRDVVRDTPWGTMTYMEYRYRVDSATTSTRKSTATAAIVTSTGSYRRGTSRR
jgi:N-acetylneuraminate synthase